MNYIQYRLGGIFKRMAQNAMHSVTEGLSSVQVSETPNPPPPINKALIKSSYILELQ